MNNKEIIIAKGLSFPLNIPFSISKSKDTITIDSNGFKFPLVLPFALSSQETKPPVNTSAGLSLPLSLPFAIASSTEEGRKKFKNSYIVTEEAWVFQGIVFDENVISLMNAQVLLLEEVKGRILVDLVLVDKNHIKLKWYGSEVETVQVFKKLDIDDKYEQDGEPIPWEEGNTTIVVSDSSYNIMLKGPRGSGESGVIDLSDTSAHKIVNDLKIALNEKTYFLKADFKEVHTLNINF